MENQTITKEIFKAFYLNRKSIYIPQNKNIIYYLVINHSVDTK